jgi:hypothetical protein
MRLPLDSLVRLLRRASELRLRYMFALEAAAFEFTVIGMVGFLLDV